MSQRQQIIDSVESYIIGNLNKHKMNIELMLDNKNYGKDVMDDIDHELELMSLCTTKLYALKNYINV